MKKCAICQKERSDDHFRTVKTYGVKHLYSYCKFCDRKQRIEKNRQNPAKYLCNSAKGNAKAKNLEFDITPEDIIVPDVCPVLGIPIQVLSEDREASASIDRIDSTKGYVKGNVVVISAKANRLKNNATVEELEAILKWMRSSSIVF